MEEIIEWLCELLDFDTTPHGPDSGPCAGFIGETLSVKGAAVQIWTTPGSVRAGHHLLAEAEGTGPEIVMLHAHLDTADHGPPQLWRFRADRASRRNGCVCGRGAIDCKGPLAVWMKLLSDAAGKKPLPYTLRLLVTDLEEQGGQDGLGLLLKQHPEILSGVKLVIGEGGGFPVPFRGRMYYTFQTGERPTETERPSAEGEDPTPGQISRILSMGIEKGYYSARLRSYVSEAVTLTGRKLDVRTLYAGMEAFFENAPPSRVFGLYGQLFETELRKEIPSARLLPVITPGISDNRWFRAEDVPVIGFFPLDSGNSLGGIHGPDEYVREASLALAYRTMSGVLGRLVPA